MHRIVRFRHFLAPLTLLIIATFALQPAVGTQSPSAAAQGVTTPASCGIWNGTATPATPSTNTANQINLGVRFRASVDGVINGICFYKGPTNTSVHQGDLWASDGTNLGTFTFTNETAIGWQVGTFASPIQISANTIYTASYHTSAGGWSLTQGEFGAPVINGPLEALAASDGGNGVFVDSPTSAFPTGTIPGWNFWVDVIFSPAASPSPTPTATATATSTATGAAATATSTAPATSTATATATSTTPPPNTAACSLWNGAATPVHPSANSGTHGIEVGVRIRPQTDGVISGICFYKGTRPGVNIANLWSSTGVNLGTTTFTDANATGWQVANFGSPVAVAANTVYTASYHTPVGGWALTENQFLAPYFNGGMEALAASDGGNGMYIDGPSAFPSNSFNTWNFWVDVIFTPASSSSATPTSTATPTNAATATPTGIATATSTSTATATPPNTATATPTNTATAIPTNTATAKPPNTATANATNTATAIASSTTTATPTSNGTAPTRTATSTSPTSSTNNQPVFAPPPIPQIVFVPAPIRPNNPRPSATPIPTPTATATAAPTLWEPPAPSLRNIGSGPAGAELSGAPTQQSTDVSSAPQPNESASAPWLAIIAPTQAYSVSFDQLWMAVPGEYYRVVGEEDGWFLAVMRDDSTLWTVWLQIDFQKMTWVVADWPEPEQTPLVRLDEPTSRRPDFTHGAS